jgi:hypothetical protein
MEDLRNTLSIGCWRLPRISTRPVSLVYLCLASIIRNLRHPALCYTLDIPKMLKVYILEFMSLCTYVPGFYEINPYIIDYREMLELVRFIRLDIPYHPWFVRFILHNENIHNLNPFWNAHVWYYSYGFQGEEHAYCKWCMKCIIEINELSMWPERCVTHKVLRSQRYSTLEIMTDDRHWCAVCQVVPLFRIFSEAECTSMLGTYWHKCHCWGEQVCLECFDEDRSVFQFKFLGQEPDMDFLRILNPKPHMTV